MRFDACYFHSNITGDVNVENSRSDVHASFECNKTDACQLKENDKRFDVSQRQNAPGDQKSQETPGSSNTEAMYGPSSPNSIVHDNAVIEMKPKVEETALVSNSTDANLSGVASVCMEKAKLDLSLSQNTSADVEMLSPESPTCKSLVNNSSGERQNPCTEAPQAPCAKSSSSEESTKVIDPRAGPGTVCGPDVTAMETENPDIPVSGGNSSVANEDSSGSQSQSRYTYRHNKVFSWFTHNHHLI